MKLKVFHHAFGDNGKHVATIDTPEVPRNDALEHAYNLTNSINLPWFINEWATEEARNGCRSTSVGDVIKIEESLADDGFYKVSLVGFELIGTHVWTVD